VAIALAEDMRVSPSTEINIRSSAPGAGVTVRAIEKTSPSSGLDHYPPPAPESETSAPPRAPLGLVCQPGTETFDPIWDGPRLLPTFVAQVLGQVMPERRVSTSVETAYGTARLGRMALLLDRRS
jgi:hypothetical protein